MARYPIDNHRANPTWENLFIAQNGTFHRKTILQQGRVNFRETFTHNGYSLSPTDIELIYRYYYFQLHYSSSYVVFKKRFSFLKKKLLKERTTFVDIGSGPFTSVMALKALCFTNNYTPKFTTINVDIAPVMITAANEAANYSNERLFTTINYFKESYQAALQSEVLTNSKLIIINLCYFLSSNQLNIDNFISDIQTFIHVNKDSEILFIYQNPDNPELNQNWTKLKNSIEGFRSLKNSNSVENVSFNDATGSWNTPKNINKTFFFDYLYKH